VGRAPCSMSQRCYGQTMSHALSRRAAVLILMTFGFSAGWPGSVKPATSRGLGASPFNAVPERCPVIKDSGSPMHCYERFGLTVAQAGTPNGTSDDAWRLVRTPDPAGGRDAVSITRTADVAKSDLEFAGLMLRCGERSAEILIVLVRALPPRAHPKVKLIAGASTAELTASVVPPDVLLLLPSDATALATGAWQGATELSVSVEDQQGEIRGVIPLVGLGHALALLRSACATQ
jgi:hypothetical protein